MPAFHGGEIRECDITANVTRKGNISDQQWLCCLWNYEGHLAHKSVFILIYINTSHVTNIIQSNVGSANIPAASTKTCL